jgi:hypothetical protein
VTQIRSPIHTDLQQAHHADRVDDTSVKSDLRTFPNLQIDAVLEATAEVEWIIALGGLERDGAPVKWRDAERTVLSDSERVGARARRALAESCIIVITDPLELVRNLEISLAEQHGKSTHLSQMLVVASSARSSDSLFLPERALASYINTAVARDVFDSSGAGYIASRVLAAADVEMLEEDGWPSSADTLGWRPTTLRETVKLAAKSTALAAPSLLVGKTRLTDEASFWLDGAARIAGFELREIGCRSLLVDEGDSATIRGLQSIQAVASEQASAVLGHWTTERTGSIRTGNDASDLRLCGADIGAGFARHLVSNLGFARLLKEIPRVLYNGRSLTHSFAQRLDERRVRYRALLSVDSA